VSAARALIAARRAKTMSKELWASYTGTKNETRMVARDDCRVRAHHDETAFRNRTLALGLAPPISTCYEPAFPRLKPRFRRHELHRSPSNRVGAAFELVVCAYCSRSEIHSCPPIENSRQIHGRFSYMRQSLEL